MSPVNTRRLVSFLLAANLAAAGASAMLAALHMMIEPLQTYAVIDVVSGWAYVFSATLLIELRQGAATTKDQGNE